TELRELVGIWFGDEKFSSGHAGIARALSYLIKAIGMAYQGSQLQIELVLRLTRQIEYICQMCGGIPTDAATDEMISTNNMSVSVVGDIQEKMACGESVDSGT
ncbi:hypothetical protein GN958_ATG17652, partial [Phytophthora infestans]